MWILCLLKYIIPKYEIIYSNQRSYGIPKFSKTKDRFEIRYSHNLLKIRRLILFNSKCLDLGIWAQGFLKPSAKSEICTFQIWYIQNFAKIKKLILFDPKCSNLGHWALNF